MTVVVTGERRTVMGISAVVVRDTVTNADGQPVEITDDWFTQDRAGNVWYLGEVSREYENGAGSAPTVRGRPASTVP